MKDEQTAVVCHHLLEGADLNRAYHTTDDQWFFVCEQDDGREVELKGWLGPIRPQSCYLRLWFGHQVLILDSREGFKRQRKTASRIKLIFGLVSS